MIARIETTQIIECADFVDALRVVGAPVTSIDVITEDLSLAQVEQLRKRMLDDTVLLDESLYTKGYVDEYGVLTNKGAELLIACSENRI